MTTTSDSGTLRIVRMNSARLAPNLNAGKAYCAEVASASKAELKYRARSEVLVLYWVCIASH